MGIQDLGAIGEFISSLVIVVTLMVLIYEVRGAKQATLLANAHERQRRRDETNRSLADSPDLAAIQSAANQHLGGWPLAERAAEFGLEPEVARYARVAQVEINQADVVIDIASQADGQIDGAD